MKMIPTAGAIAGLAVLLTTCLKAIDAKRTAMPYASVRRAFFQVDPANGAPILIGIMAFNGASRRKDMK
jgi:hypothetical protein